MAQRIKAVFTWTEVGEATARMVEGIYAEGGLETVLHGQATEEGLIPLGNDAGATHVLHFLDTEKLLVVSLADEMGGFTVEVLVGDLVLSQ